MSQRTLVGCLLISGLTALVYQIVWVRLLGLAFGTTTLAISAVLAVFFGGLALGNALAARRCRKLRSPLRAYGILELFIGAYALASLPVLGNLHRIYAWLPMVDVDAGGTWTAIQLAATAVVLLPPTVAMGATLPVVSRGIVTVDATRGRWSALLYAANTAGAVAGAWLSGLWLIPLLGLSRCTLAAATLNVVVGLAALRVARETPAPPPDADPAPARRRPFLLYFALSGFVAIGYEVVWSKAFGIVMEGTLAGFTAVLSGFLLGIAVGSAVMARHVDRLRDLPAVFAGLHLAIGVCVIAGAWAIPQLPWLYTLLTGGAGAAAPSLLFLLVVPLIAVPTALFGAAFPVLVRHYTSRAGGVGRGVGEVTAANTLGSIAGSLCVGLAWLPAFGSDATLYLLVVLDLATALWILVRHSATGRPRWRTLAGAAALTAMLALSYNGVGLADAVTGKRIDVGSWSEYRSKLESLGDRRLYWAEGRSALVTVAELPERLLLLTNGLPEASLRYGPPHLPVETVQLALHPYLAAGRPERALVVGLGGGSTLAALERTPVERIEVVELERSVVDAVELMYRGRPSPLDDPRVEVRIGDGRNDLLRRGARGEAGYDLIASQPSHPWRVGAANLFTEEFFRTVRAALDEDGAFAAWIAGFRTDRKAFLAILASFERVFPGAVLADASQGGRESFLLLGARRPVRIDPADVEALLSHPGAAALLRDYDIDSVESFLAGFEGPVRAFASLAPDASNRDDNAFVETRAARIPPRAMLDYASLEREIAAAAPVLPPLERPVDVEALARFLLARIREGSAEGAKLERLVSAAADRIDPQDARAWTAAAQLRDPRRREPAIAELRALAASPDAPAEPVRLLAEHWEHTGHAEQAAGAFAEAWRRGGRPEDAFRAGAVLYGIDPPAAREWLARIPDGRRGDFPALAVFELDTALRRGERGAGLRARYERVQALLSGPASWRELPDETHAVAAAAARALGDDAAGRAHAHVAEERSRSRVGSLLGQARRQLEADEPRAAWRTLERAEEIVASYGPLLRLRVLVATRLEDPTALEEALSAIRRWAPSRAEGLAAENRLRFELGLPLRVGAAETRRGDTRAR